MRRLALLALAASSAASAQVNLLPSTGWGFAPIVSGWHFATPLATSAGRVGDAAQAAVPFQVRVGAGAWSFDVTGAYATGAVHLTSVSGSGGNSGFGNNANNTGSSDTLVLLNGPTDVKVRASGPLVGDRLLLVAGVNLPTGTTRLNAGQLNVLQTVSAPGLAMPVPAYGMGTGGTLGVIEVVEAAGWTLALGGSLEKRTEYTPIALAVSAGSGSDTRLTPGIATHLTLGADRVVGSSRLSVLLLTDMYGTDQVAFVGGGTESEATHYRLGPQVAAFTRLDFAGDKWSEGALSLSMRHRSAFADASGSTVAGSDGNYIDGSLGGVLGGGDRTGLVVGVDGRWHSGLPFTTALVGAAATVGGATLGVETRHFRLAMHGQYGTFDTGVSHSTGYGASLSLSFFAGRGQP
jgi:hypothetical protein